MTRSYLDQVVDGAAWLLEDTGVGFRSPRASAFLQERLKGVVVRGDRICFSRDTVAEFLAALKESHAEPETPAGLGHGDPWSCLNVYDHAAAAVRPATEEDLVRAVRFLDAYGVTGTVPPVSLAGHPPALRDLEATRVCLECSTVYGGPTQTPSGAELELYREMATVTARPMPILAMLIANPLRYDDRCLELVMDHTEDDSLAIQILGGMASIGNSAPISFPAAHILVLAEGLSASLFARAATGAVEPPYLRSDPFDMRYANYVVGGPEYTLLDMASRRIHEHLTSRPRYWGHLLSMSRKPDLQAMYERTAGCWIQALNGATWFKGSGQLASDEVFSSEQVVIDRSIVRGAERLVRGIEGNATYAECRDLIREGLAEGTYLASDDTVANWRDFYPDRDLFPSTNLGQWLRAGEPDPLDSAAAVVESLASENTYARPPEQIAELRRICALARER